MAETISLPTNAQVEGIKTVNTSIDAKLGAMKTTGEDTNSKAGDIKAGVARLVEVAEFIASKTGAFVTLAVTAATRDGVEVTGQTVSLYIWDADSGAYALAATKPYNGETVDFTVGYKAKYKVTISDTLTTRQDGLYDHFAPSEATGTALIDAAITLTYLDSGDNPDFIPGTSAESVPKTNIHSPTEFDRAERAIKAQYDNDLQRIEAGLAFLVGVELPDVWTKDNGTDAVNDPLICADFSECEDADGNTFLGATLMRKWATVNSVMLDNRNQEVAAEDTAQSGIYYYGYGAPYDATATYAKNSVVSYDGHLYLNATATPTGGEEWTSGHWSDIGILTNGKIAPYDATATYALNTLCHYTDTARGFTGIYKCTTAIETAEEWNAGHWTLQVVDALEARIIKLSTLSAGDTLPKGDYAAIFRTSLTASGTYVQNAIRYGHNNYGTSANLQYFNSAAGVGKWWRQKHAGQVAPFNPGTTTVRGYMAGCSEELLGLVKKVKVPCYANSNTDSAQGAYTVLATFFLPSGTNFCGSVNANEGHVFQYMVDYLVEALVDAGKTVEAYNPEATSEAGKIYVNRNTWLFYVSNGSGGYTNVTNDDRPNTTTDGLIASNRRRFSVTNHSSAVSCRLRSANRSYAYNAWYVSSTGNLSGSYTANYAFAAVPACVI